jgi:TonB family protein
MKWCFLLVLAVLAFLTQTVPAFAADKGTVTLIPLTALHTGVVSAPAKCNKPAAIDGEMYVDVPKIASLQGVSGISTVKIDLSATGALAGEALFASSGNPWLDLAALDSPRTARFTPEMVNCAPVAGSYLYQVDF